jgi:hypothetical protein
VLSQAPEAVGDQPVTKWEIAGVVLAVLIGYIHAGIEGVFNRGAR